MVEEFVFGIGLAQVIDDAFGIVVEECRQCLSCPKIVRLKKMRIGLVVLPNGLRVVSEWGKRCDSSYRNGFWQSMRKLDWN